MYLHTHMIYCSGESFVFKSKFTGWEGVLKEDYSIVKGEKKTSEKRALKVTHSQHCTHHVTIHTLG